MRFHCGQDSTHSNSIGICLYFPTSPILPGPHNLFLNQQIGIFIIFILICPSLAVLAVIICGVGVHHSICRSISHLPQCHQVEYGVRGEGYNNNNNNTGSGGQRGWEKCDSSIAVFLTQG